MLPQIALYNTNYIQLLGEEFGGVSSSWSVTKIKWGRGARENKAYFPNIINELTNSLSKSRQVNIHFVSKFDCISKSEII
jgi:hypothetical protein